MTGGAAPSAPAASAEARARALLERSEAVAGLRPWIALDGDRLLAAAREADARGPAAGPLAGLLVAVKDNVETAALPTTAGTPALAAHPPARRDAPAVARLRAAGAVVAGKANLHELAFGVTSANAWSGPVRNPYDPARVAGGSSGGTAVAVATGLVPAGLATDTGGSARIPAALCGVVGFRPTHGRYPGEGLVPISPSRDTVGIIARSVEEVAAVDAVLAGHAGPGGPGAARAAGRGGPAGGARALSGLRLGVPRRWFHEDLDPRVAAAVEAALDAMAGRGAELVEVEVPGVAEVEAEASFAVALFEARRELAAYLPRAAGLTLPELVAEVRSPDVRRLLEGMLADPVPEGRYRAALAAVAGLRTAYAEVFRAARVAALAFPTVPMPAPPVGDHELTRHNGREAAVFPTLSRATSPGSLAGVPGLTLPLALPGGLPPVGLELDGPAGADRALLALGAAVAGALPPVPPPPLPA